MIAALTAAYLWPVVTGAPGLVFFHLCQRHALSSLVEHWTGRPVLTFYWRYGGGQPASKKLSSSSSRMHSAAGNHCRYRSTSALRFAERSPASACACMHAGAT